MGQTIIYKTMIFIRQPINRILEDYNDFAKYIQTQRVGYRNLKLLRQEDLKTGVNLIINEIENKQQWLILIALEKIDNTYNCKFFCKCDNTNGIENYDLNNFDLYPIYDFLKYNRELLAHYIIFPKDFKNYRSQEINKLRDLFQDCRVYYILTESGYIKGEIHHYKNINGLNFEFKYRIDTKELALRVAVDKKYTKGIPTINNIDTFLKETVKKSIKFIAKTNPDLLFKITSKELL